MMKSKVVLLLGIAALVSLVSGRPSVIAARPLEDQPSRAEAAKPPLLRVNGASRDLTLHLSQGIDPFQSIILTC